MGDGGALVALSASMFVGCYLSGLIPISMKLSEDKINVVSIFGAGLLVGTALTVIIPEGVSTLYMSRLEEAHKTHHEETPTDASHSGHHHEAHHFDDPHSLIGITLVMGFVFMLLVDQCSKGRKSTEEILPSSSSSVSLSGAVNRPGSSISKRARPATATLGLVVHAAADGVALGAAATTTRAEIEMIVFLAIMLHKAPAAFALVSFLLHEGLDRSTIRRHLLLFSAAAPILALTTYFGISQNTKESMASMNATGIAMLFSAGTFLYVATVHVLPELAASKGNKMPYNPCVPRLRRASNMSGRCSSQFCRIDSHSSRPSSLSSTFYSPGGFNPRVPDDALVDTPQRVHIERSFNGGHSHHPTVVESSDVTGFSRKELVLLVVGAMMPCFLSFGHHH